MRDDSQGKPTTELLSGLVTDARNLLAGHGEALRANVATDFADLKRTLELLVITSVGAGLAILLAVAAVIAALVELGVPAWLALSGAAVFLIVATFAVLARARAAGRKTSAAMAATTEGIEIAGADARWAVERAAATLTESNDVTDGQRP